MGTIEGSLPGVITSSIISTTAPSARAVTCCAIGNAYGGLPSNLMFPTLLVAFSAASHRWHTEAACILGKPRLSGRQELSRTASFWHPTQPFRLAGGCAFRPITCMSTAAQSREHRSVSAGDVKEPDLI
jgi:hypothetical protein